MKHRVVEDKTGYSPWAQYERIICLGEDCMGDCVVRQPWMNDEQWKNLKGKLRLKHPAAE